MNIGTAENIVTVLLCSTLGYDPEDKSVKPFTVAQFNALERKLGSAIVPIGYLLSEGLESVSKRVGLTADEKNRISVLMLRADKISAELNRLAQRKIYIVTKTESNYPKRLKTAMGDKAPRLFFYCGDLALLKNSTVAIIGSREASGQENAYARKHAKMSAQNDITVVSGGARGIDTVAKEAALKAGGSVVTYVSDHMVKCITDNAEAILWGKMLVLSAFHPEMSFRGYNALERNKFIYASSDYAVVVSCGDGTGGSYKGAVECLNGKLTKLYVKNDELAPAGNKRLITMGGLPLNEEHERLD